MAASVCLWWTNLQKIGRNLSHTFGKRLDESGHTSGRMCGCGTCARAVGGCHRCAAIPLVAQDSRDSVICRRAVVVTTRPVIARAVTTLPLDFRRTPPPLDRPRAPSVQLLSLNWRVPVSGSLGAFQRRSAPAPGRYSRGAPSRRGPRPEGPGPRTAGARYGGLVVGQGLEPMAYGLVVIVARAEEAQV